MRNSPPVEPAVVIDAGLIDAVIFDMDGVTTDTVRVHQAAWAQLFDRLTVAGTPTALVTASGNRAEVIEAAGVPDRFDVHVDGRYGTDHGLAGKPAPDMFLEAARLLGVDPARTVVIEDAVAGVSVGSQGGFGLVIGLDRAGQPDAPRSAGADAVVADVSEIAVVGESSDTFGDATESTPQRSAWHVAFSEFDPAAEGHREALCALGNGIFATRGAAAESSADGIHYPGTYAAGLYNRLVSRVAGHDEEHESLVNLPNWLPLSFRATGGNWLDLTEMQVGAYVQRLDLRAGILYRSFTVTDSDGRTTRVAERRIVHAADPHLAAIEWAITPVDWSGTLEIRSGLDGGVENRNVAAEHELASQHITGVETGTVSNEIAWLNARTTQSQRHVTIATRTRILGDSDFDPPGWRTVGYDDRIEQLCDVTVNAGSAVTVEKVASLTTSLDHAIADTRSAALEWLGDVGSFDELLSAHEEAWALLWSRAHLDLRSDDIEAVQTLNLHTFHVLQALSPHVVDRDVGVPARGLTGEGYRGHVFWDELFVFPFLNLRFPALTRELLLYRYRRLPAARRQAKAMGCRGARFPWQSGSDGREETPERFFNPRSKRWMPDNSHRQHHVSLAIAYELCQYRQVSGDDTFLASYGAELLVEIARFWADLADHDPETGRYHIRGVMGPDEFHDGYPDRPGEGIDDNAYTNVMVCWLFQRVIDTHERLGDRALGLWQRLGLDHEEVNHWEHLSRRLHVPFHGDGIISQFDGYEHLAELDWEAYRARYENIGRLDLILEAEGDTTNRYQAAKQADVLMLLYLFSSEELTELLTHLGYDFDPARIPAIVDYYTARMTHGSTLCRVAMAWVLARTDRARSWEIFRQALRSDIDDIQGGTTREGIHLGAMAGTIDLIQRCYTGIETRGDILRFNPRLPDEIDRLEFGFDYRGQHIDTTITADRIELATIPGLGAGGPITVDVAGHTVQLNPPDHVVIDLLGES